jgi:hypothetical protein
MEYRRKYYLKKLNFHSLLQRVTSSAFSAFCQRYVIILKKYLINLPIFPTPLTGSFFIVVSTHFSLIYYVCFMNISKLRFYIVFDLPD